MRRHRVLRRRGDGPLKVVVTATRREFEDTLRCLVADPVGWGAFYDARTGNVYVSLEPARCLFPSNRCIRDHRLGAWMSAGARHPDTTAAWLAAQQRCLPFEVL